ncbi:ParB/RepB/Spo0J family partition protein [Hufsiella ginkgonis]|uniref:ParB/RepB/Spo0J family partition protein n=1 Tax=Hufsiella ginkgonis TaxID=2695274 RepID=A0A7K1Y178_9SPHI|nr:ParB/RepB/Spo0J family partition protein [Hufsiella ginkgonis]MXV17005.1 ParB/RepB/Spo0J family partition protein [Hufsiella ginkgonis]
MTYQKKTGLGRGLGALLDDTDKQNTRPGALAANEGPAPGSISHVLVSQVEVNPFQPRTAFDQLALQELSDSIKLQGLIQPITVRKTGPSAFQIISGERRFRASRMAGLTEVPAYIRTANDQQMLEMALIENIQRENLNAIEVALSFQRMIDECKLKQEELGDRVSKNRSTVTNYLRLLKLPPAIQVSVRDNNISMGHAKALLGLEGSDKQLYVHREILSRNLSVRKAEELVRALQQSGKVPSESKKTPAMTFQYQKVQDDLASKFATRVKLKMQSQGKGAIEIPFVSDDDLNRILELLDW